MIFGRACIPEKSSRHWTISFAKTGRRRKCLYPESIYSSWTGIMEQTDIPYPISLRRCRQWFIRFL